MNNYRFPSARAAVAILLSGLVLTSPLPAQAPTFTVTPTAVATALAQSIVGTGVTLVGTPTLTGAPEQSGLFEAFTTGPYTNPVTNASGTVSIPRGVILSSGRVQSATGTYLAGGDTDLNGPGDTTLTTIAGFPTHDAVSLQFSFIPDADEIFIEFLFASTEYPEYVNSSFNDVFGFFVNGVNAAVVPGTTDPVTINSINAGRPVGTSARNPQFFTRYSTSNTPFNYGGATVLLTTRAAVRKGEVNTFRFAIADASDGSLDSAVLIGAGQFTTAPPATGPSIGTTSLPAGQLQSSYSAALTATGGTQPYSWSLASGSLPPGLTMTSAGVIAGIPMQPGTFPFAARVTDNAGLQASVALSITITSTGLQITSMLPGATALEAYSVPLTAVGGVAPFQWAVTSGSLPPGFSLSSSGVLSGVGAEAGSHSFGVRVTDVSGLSATATLTLNIAPRAVGTIGVEIATEALPQASVGKIYAMVLAARGGGGPYSWSISGLPPGLTANSAGEIIGTPTAAGTFAVQAIATDASGVQSQRTLPLVVVLTPVVITTQTASSGRQDQEYSLGFAATGGLTPYTWTVLNGSLPGGLTLRPNGILSGTPSQQGTYSFSLQAADSAGQVATRSFTLAVGPPVLVVLTESLGNTVLGAPFATGLTASGGLAPYRWTATGLPEGLTLNPNTGAITGAATRTGRFEVSVRVTDDDNQSAVRSYTVIVTAQVTVSTAIGNLITGSPVLLPLSATGGTAPYSWSVTGGSLPDGIALSQDGRLSGLPGTQGEFTFTIEARDVNNVIGSRTYSVRVVAPLRTTTQSAPSAPIGSPYALQLSATGGTPPYRWSLVSGNLPAGLSLSESGAVAGTPTTPGLSTFTVRVSDSAATPQSANLPLTINVPLPDVSGLSIALPANPQAGQQVGVGLTIGSPYPVEVSGVLSLSFAPNAVNNADDPAIQFSTGGRSIPFTIPAGQTRAVFRVADLQVQTGTTAGTITLTSALTAGGGAIGCNCPLTQTIVIPRTAPAISSVRATRSATGLTIVVSGFSTTREITQATFRFTGGASLQTTELTVPLTAAMNTYFQGAAAAQFGGQFAVTTPFTVQGETSTVNSVTVTLTNATGTSQPVTANF